MSGDGGTDETHHTRARARWSLVLLVLAGAIVLVVLVRGREHPAEAPAVERVRAVRVIEAPSMAVVPRARGYGEVRPGRVWQAVAEVGGRVVHVTDRLEAGAVVATGTVLARIDAADYELAVAQAEAEIASIEAELAELGVREESTRVSLGIEREALALAERELERKRTLTARGTVPRSELERQQRDTLAQRQSVQSLENTLARIPAERRVLEARRAQARARLEAARRDLARTEIRAPFDARIAEVNVEQAQFVRVGEVLAVADGIARAEIEAQIPIGRMKQIVSRSDRFVFDPSDPNLFDELGLSAHVRLEELPGPGWEARVARIGALVDPRTRTVGVIVEVDEPYRRAEPGVRPPLIKGMFAHVVVSGRARPESVVVPREALHGARLYLADADDRLEIRGVDVVLAQGDFAVVGEGLAAGERVVVSDPVPAIEGMKLDPTIDEAAAARLREAAVDVRR